MATIEYVCPKHPNVVLYTDEVPDGALTTQGLGGSPGTQQCGQCKKGYARRECVKRRRSS